MVGRAELSADLINQTDFMQQQWFGKDCDAVQGVFKEFLMVKSAQNSLSPPHFFFLVTKLHANRLLTPFSIRCTSIISLVEFRERRRRSTGSEVLTTTSKSCDSVESFKKTQGLVGTPRTNHCPAPKSTGKMITFLLIYCCLVWSLFDIAFIFKDI